MSGEGRPGSLPGLGDRRFAAVIFDMDGTLIDSTPAVLRSWTTWAIEHGVTAEDLAGYHGVPSAGVVRAVVAAEHHETAIARIEELELADVDDIIALPGAADALAGLVGARTAIATSCTRGLFEARLGAAGLTPPTVVITVDDVERGKPAPDPFLAAAEALGVAPADCLVVEDAPKGIEAARAAGCAVLAVTTTSTPTELVGADVVIGTLADVAFRPGRDEIVVDAR